VSTLLSGSDRGQGRTALGSRAAVVARLTVQPVCPSSGNTVCAQAVTLGANKRHLVSRWELGRSTRFCGVAVAMAPSYRSKGYCRSAARSYQ
jgi:hypothetical protein